MPNWLVRGFGNRQRVPRATRRFLRESRRNPGEVFWRLKREQGDVAVVPLGGDSRMLLLTHPEDIHRVLVSNDANYARTLSIFPGQRVDLAEPNSLIGPQSDPELRLEARRIIRTPYKRNHLDFRWPEFLEIAERGVAEWADRDVIEVVEAVRVILIQISVLGLTEQELGMPIERYISHTDAMLDLMFPAESKFYRALEHLQFRRMWQVQNALTEMNALLLGHLRRARARGKGEDLYSVMVEVGKKYNVDDEQLTVDILGHLLALGSNPGFAIASTLHLLRDRPDISELVRQEADELFANPTDLPPELPWTHAAIAEALRFAPVFDRLTRQARGPDQLPGGFTLKAGDQILICPDLVHYDERWWRDPESYLPERWLEKGQEERPRCSYLAFGAGPRMCAGEYVGWLSMHATLAAIMHHWDLPLQNPDKAPRVDPVSRKLLGFKARPVPRTASGHSA